jgi:holo-[acyl-carrier protein] synthase
MTAIGIDLLEIERLEQALDRRPRLAERLFTESERTYAAARARPARHLAARFCAKEAVSKALGVPLRPREVEIVSGAGGPSVLLTGVTAERAVELGVGIQVSLTHGQDLAAAVAAASPR